jgi:phage-related tail fiber protein
LASTVNISLTGTQTIDGVVGSNGDRILVKNQTTASQNGIYIMASGAWSRATDYDATVEVTAGDIIPIQEGATNADTSWELSTDGAITVGTTSLTYSYFGGLKAPTPATSNKEMTASVTSADFQAACATTLATAPNRGGMIDVYVNGANQILGDGVKTKDCYFSADSGTTAKAISSIAAGDTLYWVGSVAGFQLAATDKISFSYNILQ